VEPLEGEVERREAGGWPEDKRLPQVGILIHIPRLLYTSILIYIIL
jgi:hypothetical protein